MSDNEGGFPTCGFAAPTSCRIPAARLQALQSGAARVKYGAFPCGFPCGGLTLKKEGKT
jgi:hypothetical protein